MHDDYPRETEPKADVTSAGWVHNLRNQLRRTRFQWRRRGGPVGPTRVVVLELDGDDHARGDMGTAPCSRGGL